MWNVKAKVIPLIKGATRIISKSLRQHLSITPGKHEIKELQKPAIFGTSHITTESANVKVQNIFHGRNNIICNTNCKYSIAATLYTYTLETRFLSGK